MNPAIILALISIIDGAATLIQKHANGQNVTAEDLTPLQDQTRQLSDQIDAMRTDKP
jgi:hypothetical protein